MQSYFSDEDVEEKNPKNKKAKIQMTNSTNQVFNVLYRPPEYPFFSLNSPSLVWFK
jgi:hypothetical protein